MADDKPHYAGHRERLRNRFMQSGADSLADYEMLELLLFQAIPRRDVKPLAKGLIDRFGSYAGVIAAEPAQLRETPGLGEGAVVALKLAQASALRLARDQVMNQPVLTSWQALMDYCHAAMAHEKTERLRVLYLNKRNMLIADELQQKGTVDHTPLYPREVVKRALELQATALILVHNHPSGDPTPSRADIEMTREVKDTAEKLGIVLHDHIIVSKRGPASFKTMGLI